ncbi:hypothetical protein PCCS19_45820 [Paenibacillus sp. CCS19]|uniref:putative amidoligase domain-containing protein n=1 Tax=Paenibacillus sp. CCS19 TaxID=3158387 RepID=UPI00256C1958|nr:hypothetical protein [Paenibacillus cellulosilyticus]GMK41525.1 hypothetical protein PCCS19_45820 [Paenibacillus cellulosilyticus]
MPAEEHLPVNVRVLVWDDRAGSSDPVHIDSHDALIVVSGSPRVRRDGSEKLSCAGSNAAAWTLLAPGAAAQLRIDQAEIARRWSRAGLLRHAPIVDRGISDWRESVQEALRDGWRVYAVSVFHLEVIAMERWLSIDKGVKSMSSAISTAAIAATTIAGERMTSTRAAINGQELTKQMAADPALRRVSRAAIRALYSIGLDLGVAVVAIDGEGRTAALAVQSVPSFREREGLIWADAVERFQTMYANAISTAGKPNKRVLIGADPEFVLLKPNGRIASAERYFGVGGGAGADALLIGQRLMYPIGELRPDPASSPDELAANVRRQLIRADAKVREEASLLWAAGAMPVSGIALGGHIHLSGVPLTSRLLRQLDRYVGLPIAMIESDSGRRPRYGMLGDYRQQPHGGFEYRTLPSWLVSPAAAKAAFALALLCAQDTWSLPAPPLLPEQVEDAFYRGDRIVLARQLDAIAEELAKAPSYPTYARWIKPLFAAARSGTVWDTAADIRRKWRVGPFAT